MATHCPKCRGTNVSGGTHHGAAHGVHTGLHLMTHVSPVLGLMAMIATGINALTATPSRICACGHRF